MDRQIIIQENSAWHTTCDFKGYFIEELDKTMFAPIILTPYKYAIKW